MALIQNDRVDRLQVRVFDTRSEMGADAGNAAANYLREVLLRQETANVMFAAAPSQNETLAALCAAPGIDWRRVNAFHMDEYIGLSATHPAGFRNFLRRAVFDKLPLGEVYLLNGDAADPQQAARDYEAALRAHPLDLCLCGIGENGHLAFNDPPTADFEDKVLVKIVKLDETCRMQQVHDKCFESIDQVPTHALTATIPALVHAKKVVCTVPGTTKAQAVRRMLCGSVGTDCPASILRRHEDAALYLDRDAAHLL